MNHYFQPVIFLLLFIPWSAPDEQRSVLPQDHEYQITLRTYLETLTEEDFAIALRPLTYGFDYFSSEDDLFKTWILFRQAPPQGPIADTKGITVEPKHFTLESIESEQGILMGGGSDNRPWIATDQMAWWSAWDYPGNPYYGNEALKRRAFVYCAVDMIMNDEAHEKGENKRSDYLGGTLIWLSYTYYKIKDILPADVRSAYETGLIKFFERIEEWGPRGSAADMDQFAHVGLWYTAKAIGDEDLKHRARAHSEYILSEHLRPAGYIDHGDGFDPTYNGISLDFLGWAALASGYDFFKVALDRMSKLKAYLSLPEPEGRYYGPSHFSTATSGDSPNDQRGLFSRDLGIAMVSDQAKYLIWEGRGGQSHGHGVPGQAEMLDRIEFLTRRTNNHFERNDSKPGRWERAHWTDGIIYAHEYYPPGFYEKLRQIEAGQDPVRRAPFNRDENFIHRFPENDVESPDQHKDEFLAARFAEYGVIIHTGRLSWWGGTSGQSGFGGGALSAFWTKNTGSVILGRTGGFQGPAPDTWENWREWPTHAISGQTGSGEGFSSARYRYPQKQYKINGQNATVSAFGVIGNEVDGGRTTENETLGSRNYYRRDFVAGPEGLSVESAIMAGAGEEMTELYEIIPVFIGGRSSNIEQANTRISLLISGEWIKADTSLRPDVDQIRIQRHQGEVFIEFSEPQHVKLASGIWEDQYQSDARVRNILIDLLQAPKARSEEMKVHYIIHD
ncbi:MAG: hypothetical protein WD266_07260 [Balneolales bacterium]